MARPFTAFAAALVAVFLCAAPLNSAAAASCPAGSVSQEHVEEDMARAYRELGGGWSIVTGTEAVEFQAAYLEAIRDAGGNPVPYFIDADTFIYFNGDREHYRGPNLVRPNEIYVAAIKDGCTVRAMIFGAEVTRGIAARLAGDPV